MTAVAQRDGVVFVDVDITPLPTAVPAHPGGVAPSPSGDPGHAWLAVTGFEPAWLLLGAGVLLVGLGLILLRARGRRRRP